MKKINVTNTKSVKNPLEEVEFKKLNTKIINKIKDITLNYIYNFMYSEVIEAKIYSSIGDDNNRYKYIKILNKILKKKKIVKKNTLLGFYLKQEKI